MRSTITRDLPNVAATESFGRRLAQVLSKYNRALLLLQGDLGAGKTTIVRSFLQALGYGGRVKSPTYTLLETYQIHSYTVYHCDLYRIQQEAELDFLGLQDCLSEDAFCFIEWPERAPNFFPFFDLHIQIFSSDEMSRSVIVTSATKIGEDIVDAFSSFD